MSKLRVVLDGCEVVREKNPRFLGVTFDNRLLFQKHVDSIVARAKGRVRVLRRLAGSDWGWSKSLLRRTYVALVRSVLLYGVSAWGPWLCLSGWERLERVQLDAARVIAGLLRSTPREAVLAEARLPELRSVAGMRWLLEWDKCKRVAAGNPRSVWSSMHVRQRLRKVGWRNVAREMDERWLPGGVVRSGLRLSVAPTTDWTTLVCKVAGRKRELAEENRLFAVSRLRECSGVDCVVYTDGSAGGLRDGGAGVVVTGGSVEEPVVWEWLELPAGLVASSFQAELYALLAGLEWLWSHLER